MYNYRPNVNGCTSCRSMQTPTTRCEVHDQMSLAMAYVPWQTWQDIYEAEKGFRCGTIFQELNMPFLGKGGARR